MVLTLQIHEPNVEANEMNVINNKRILKRPILLNSHEGGKPCDFYRFPLSYSTFYHFFNLFLYYRKHIRQFRILYFSLLSNLTSRSS